MRMTSLLALLLAFTLSGAASARQASLREYDLPYAANDPFVGDWIGGVSIPKIGKHGVSCLVVTRDHKGRLDLLLTLGPFRLFRHRINDAQFADDVLKFTLPPPPGNTSAECEMRMDPDGQRIEGMIRFFPETPDRPPARIVAVRRPGLLEMPTLRSWTGVIDQENAPIEVTLRVGTRPDGLTVGQFDIPEHSYFGASLANIQYDEDLDLFVASLPEAVNGVLDLEILESGDRLEGRYSRERTVSPASFEADPYIDHPLWFSNEGGGHSFGILTLPTGPGPFPCVVVLGTFDVNDRDGVGADTGGHKPYLRLARELVDRGYAVFRFDDRGTGFSRDAGPATNIGAAAADASCAIAAVAAAPRIDPDRVILLGHGEGGVYAPMLAGRSPAPAGLILINAPVGPGVDLVVEQTGALMTARGLHPTRVEARTDLVREFLGALARGASDDELRGIARASFMAFRDRVPEAQRNELPTLEKAVEHDMSALGNPWMRSIAGWDNAPALAMLRMPVLAIFADRDVQVPAARAAERARQAFATGKTEGQVVVLPGLSHYLQPADSGLPEEYAQPERAPFAPAAIEAITEWLGEHFPTG